MNLKAVSKKWSDIFCRVANRDDGTPRFSLIGAKGYLYSGLGYLGGHEKLDRIIKILDKKGIKCYGSESSSPSLNVASFEYMYDFEDGGLEIYSGNHFCGPPGHGAFVVGFDAFRWLLNQLGIRQPRRFKNEWIKVAEGGDGYNTYWHELFAPVMEQIQSYIYAIEEHELDSDWKEICVSVPALKGRDWDISKEQTWNSFLQNLEFYMDCNLLEEVWDGGMPGQSGNNFELEIKTSQKQSFILTMEQFLTSFAWPTPKPSNSLSCTIWAGHYRNNRHPKSTETKTSLCGPPEASLKTSMPQNQQVTSFDR
jgi:hypothetical protein